MSPYALELAHARIDALRTLIDAMNEAETPEEKRRCAVAIFNAPEPNDLDDEIELEDEDKEDAECDGNEEGDETDQNDDSDDDDTDGTDSDEDSESEITENAAASRIPRDLHHPAPPS